MKLFRKLYMRVFFVMAALTAGILFFVLGASWRQGILDARIHGIEEIESREYLVCEQLRRENAARLGDTEGDALAVHAFREIFGTRGALWKDGRALRNDTPYLFDRGALETRCARNGDFRGLYAGSPQRVEGRWLLVFYRGRAAFAREGYSFAFYTDVTDIYVRAGRLLLCGVLFGAGALGLAAFVLYRSTARILAPLAQLRRAAEAVAAGEYDVCVPAEADDELGAVAKSFCTMARQVRAQMEALTALGEERTRLLGSLAHEMKTPMSAIIASADLLLTVRVGECERERALSYILDEAKRLARLSQKMMELTGLYVQGGQAVVLEQTRVSALLADAARAMEAALTDKGLRLRVDCRPADLEKRMDADLARSLLQNLLDNACKASDGGEIAVSADARGMYVRDFGRGIPPEELFRVTEAFYRVDRSRAQRTGGLGLGLALCAQIAKLHGWALEIESEPGAGTTVSVLWQTPGDGLGS